MGAIEATRGPGVQHELRKKQTQHDPVLTDRNTVHVENLHLSVCSPKPVQRDMLHRKLYRLKVGGAAVCEFGTRASQAAISQHIRG